MTDPTTSEPRPTLRNRVALVVRDTHQRFIFRHQLRVQAWYRAGRHHTAPIDPLRSIAVDPRAIDRWVDMESADYRRIRYRFDVRAGDWDLQTCPLSEHFVYASFVSRFVHGAAWDATEIYAVAMQGIRDSTGRYHGCRSRDALMQRFEKLDALYEQVRRNGYRSQRELERSGEPLLRRFSTRPPELDEVVVHIDRHGAFILVDGVHRFSIARILGIESIPVIVLYRHAAWQARRDDHARAGYPAKGVTAHPDLLPPHQDAVRSGVA